VRAALRMTASLMLIYLRVLCSLASQQNFSAKCAEVADTGSKK
jgi:hypothetical protein